MVHVQSIKFGAWIMISLNLLVAFCAIWMFSRMAPAIQEILSRNARSLYACEQMLGFLAHAASANTSGERVIFRQQFEHALANAKANITEYGEASALQEIENIYLLLFSKIVLAAVIYMVVVWVSGAKTVRECVQYLRKK